MQSYSQEVNGYRADVEECRKILESKGFTSDDIRYGLDEWWINKNYFRKDLLYKK